MCNLQFFIGTYATVEEEGIYHVAADRNARRFHTVKGFRGASNPSYLLRSKKRPLLYAVEELTPMGNVATYMIDGGKLERIGMMQSGGADPCHLTMDDDETYLFIANYTSGSLAAFALDQQGVPVKRTCLVQHQGKSVNPDRQEGPHAHYVAYRDGYVFVCDLGLDTVFRYELETETGVLRDTGRHIHLPAGAGPRHLVFHPQNPSRMYVLCELDAKVYAFSLDKERISCMQEIASLPKDFTGENLAAAIRISQDGKYLFVSNRGFDGITVFSVDDTGRLKLVTIERENIREPRDFFVLGDEVLVANQFTDSLAWFHFDRTGGRLRPESGCGSVTQPVCIIPA